MSCIAGILNIDGAPVWETDLHTLAEAMTGRGPDGQEIWAKGAAGFATAQLHVGSSLDGTEFASDDNVTVVADARIDDRKALVEKLYQHGEQLPNNPSHTALILAAYRVFGEQLTSHLLGDFAFAIWDEQHQTLLCGCDHFGIRPFFYVRTPKRFLLASTVDALLTLGGFSSEIDMIAIADYACFGLQLDADITVYRNIKRLPAANTLKLGPDHQFVHHCYWQVPEDTPSSAGHAELSREYLSILTAAVNDRLEQGAMAAELSGGLDSTSIAALAVEAGGAITTYSNYVEDSIDEDKDTTLAGVVARHLGTDINYGTASGYPLFATPGAKINTIEPTTSTNPQFAYDRQLTMVNKGAKVLLSGFYADALFATNSHRNRELLNNRQFFQLFSQLGNHLRTHGTLRGAGLRALLTPTEAPHNWSLPDWFTRDFVERTDLESRWQRFWDIYFGTSLQDQLRRPWMSQHFRAYEPFDLPLRVRYPFLDVRLINFMATVPNHFRHNKQIARHAMAGRLPELVLKQPKFGPNRDWLREKVCQGRTPQQFYSIQHLEKKGIIDRQRFEAAVKNFIAGQGADSTFWSAFLTLPIVVEHWYSDNDHTCSGGSPNDRYND